MRKVLGGFKNMLKRWRINLNNKKKKEQLEEEELKNKRKSSIQSFLYSCIAILYAPIGYLFAKNKTVEKKDKNQKLKEKLEKHSNEEINIQIQESLEFVNSKSKTSQIINSTDLTKNTAKTIERTLSEKVVEKVQGANRVELPKNIKDANKTDYSERIIQNNQNIGRNISGIGEPIYSKVDKKENVSPDSSSSIISEKKENQQSLINKEQDLNISFTKDSEINSVSNFNNLFNEELEIKLDGINNQQKNSEYSIVEENKSQNEFPDVQNHAQHVKGIGIEDNSELENIEKDLDDLSQENVESSLEELFEKAVEENDENIVINDVEMPTEEDIKNNLEELNKEAKELLLQVEYFDKQINVVAKYNDLYYVQNELNYLYEQIHLLREKYTILDVQTEELYSFDEFELHKDDVKLEELEEYIEDTLKKVNARKDEIFILKEQKQKDKLKEVEEKKKEEIAEKQQKQEEKKEKEFNEFEMANKIVLQDIMNQQNYLDKNLKKIKNRTSVLGYMGTFFKKMVGLNLVLLPFGLIRSPLLFGLVNSILVNNSLKTMRRLNNPKLNPNYEVLLDNYIDNKQIMLRTFQNYVDSLNELDNLETEIMNLNPNMDLLKDIEFVRSNIEKQIEKIKEKSDIIDKVYVKLKEG